MATSGSADFILTRDGVVGRAYQIVGRIQDSEIPSASQLTEGGEILNTIIHDKENDGVFPHQLDQVIQRFVLATARAGTDSLVYRCIKSHTSAAANRPITGDDWTLYWVADASATSLGAWASGQPYVSGGEYSAPVDSLAIWEAKIRDDQSNDHPVMVVSMSRMRGFLERPTDTSTWPLYAALDLQTSPKLFLHPIPTAVDASIVWQKVRRLYDFDAGANDADLWSRALRWLIYELASDLADKFHLPLEERGWISRKARLLRDRMMLGSQLETEDHEVLAPAWDPCLD